MTAEATRPHAAPTVPGRYDRDRRAQRRVAAPLLLVTGPGAFGDDADAARLARAVTERDEVALALVRAVREDGTVTMSMVRTALAHGIDAVPDAPAALRTFFATVERTPAWVDREQLAIGARALRRAGADASYVLAYGSLLGGYNNSGPLDILVDSGKLSGERTNRRLTETSVWWQGCVAEGGLDRFGDGFTLSVHVRIMHAFIDYHHAHDPDFDHDYHGVPINQFDQAGTLGLFSTSFLIHTRLLGIRYTRAERRAIMHLWCYVGWLMGVTEDLLPFTERHGRRTMYRIARSSPAADANSRALARSLIDAPLRYPYHGPLAGFRRRLAYEQGLSVATALLFPDGVRPLGVPVRPPWYPAWRFARNTVRHRVLRLLPGGDVRLQLSAEAEYRRHFARVGGRAPAGIGAIEHTS